MLGVLAAAVLFAGQWDVAATATSELRAGETIILIPTTQPSGTFGQFHGSAPLGSTGTFGETSVMGSVTPTAMGSFGPLRTTALVPRTNPFVQPSRGFVAEVLRPVADVSYRSADTTLRFDYGPRIVWQTPRPVDDEWPLILHVANLSINAHTDRSVSFAGTASGSIGKPDYSALLQTFGTTQSQVPTVTTIATGTAQATTTVQVSPTASALAGVRFFRFQILDDTTPQGGATQTSSSPAPNPNLVTSQTVLGFDPGTTVRLTARHSLTLEGSVTGAWYSNGLTYLTVTPNAVWTVRLDPYTTFRTQLGLSHARPLSQLEPIKTKDAMDMTTTITPPKRDPVTAPVGLVGIDSVVSRREGAVLRLTGEGGVNVIFDPVFGRADPRAIIRGNASLTVGPDWMFAVRGDFATSVDPPPGLAATSLPRATGTVSPITASNRDPVTVPPIVTTYSATLLARRRVTPNVVVELGAFFADRGPPLNAANFSFVQPSRWVYLMLTMSTRDIGRFTQ